MTEAILEVSAARFAYGDLVAVWDVSLRAYPGRLCGVVGRNGAGKSTLCQGIGGLLPTRSGHIRLAGQDISREDPWKRARHGLSVVLDGKRVFRDMSVQENLQIGAMGGRRRGGETVAIESAYKLFPALQNRRRVLAGELSGGQQQMLAIAQALVTEPQVIVIDEPSSGLAPVVVSEIFDTLMRLRADGMAIVVVEQLDLMIKYADDIVAISQGRVAASGSVAEMEQQGLGSTLYL
jgi:branched-chain amino acid transport system ATP-binding protein